MKALRDKVGARLTGAQEKALICKVQMISSWLFFPAGVFLFFTNHPIMGVMFLTEAIGQFLMAKDNQNTLATGDVRFRYLSPNTFGRAAAVVFAFTAFSRFWAAGFPVTGSVFCFAMIAGSLFSSRPEEIGGVILTISAFFLAVTSYQEQDILNASVQFLYGTLLVTGVLLMKASRAEVINIVLWLVLFAGLLASPQT